MRILSKRDPLYIEAIRVKQLEEIHGDGKEFAVLSSYRGHAEDCKHKGHPPLPSNKNHPLSGKPHDPKCPGLAVSENKSRHDDLLQYVERVGYQYEQAKGYWAKQPEKSLLIKGIPFAEARVLAKKYDQDAFIYKASNGPVTLYDMRAGTATPNEKTEISNNPELKTLIRNVGFNYDFSAKPFPASKALTWHDIKQRIEEYQKTMDTRKEKPTSKYEQKQ